AYIGNARYGWYAPGSTNGTSNYFDMEIMKSVFWKDIKNIGHSLADSKMSLVGASSGTYNTFRWVYLELNLFGCPQMFLKLDCPQDTLLISQITPGQNFYALQGQTTTVSAKISNGCGDTQNGINASASFSNGDSQITLNDDGTGADQTAGDGYYSGYWTPQNLGSCTITVTATKSGYTGDSESVSGTVTNISYEYDDSASFSWIDTTSGTSLSLSDEGYQTVNIGFTFDYYGSPYTQIIISANGFLKFGSAAQDFYNICIPNTSEPNNMLALYWDDLNPAYGSGIIYYKTFGTAPDRYFVVEFNNVYIYGISSSAGTFEAILYEGSNEIKYQYKDVNFGNSNYNYGKSATI
ncbi:hypothetical protein KKB18_09380, partial [bacterium]|nr:hypothetical protein [bacterium]